MAIEACVATPTPSMQWVKLVQPLSFARGFSGGKLPVLTLFTKRKVLFQMQAIYIYT